MRRVVLVLEEGTFSGVFTTREQTHPSTDAALCLPGTD